MHLSEQGFKVAVLEMTDTLAADCPHPLPLPVHPSLGKGRTAARSGNVHQRQGGGHHRSGRHLSGRPGPGNHRPRGLGGHLRGHEAQNGRGPVYSTAGDCFYLLGDCKKVANLLRLNQSALGLAGLI